MQSSTKECEGELSILKACWNALFYTFTHTIYQNKCHEMLLKLTIIFAYVSVTPKHPVFEHGHRQYVV